MDVRILFKIPAEFVINGEEKYFFKSLLDRLLPLGVDYYESQYYRTYEEKKELFVISFYFRDLSLVHKFIFNNEQFKQLKSIEELVFKKQKLDYNFSCCVGRKNKLSKFQADLILKSNKSYRQLAKEFDCSVGLIAKIKKGGD